MINKKVYVCTNKECEYAITIHTDITNDSSFKPKKCPKCKGTEIIEKKHELKD